MLYGRQAGGLRVQKRNNNRATQQQNMELWKSLVFRPL
jgi:hypothetical protein